MIPLIFRYLELSNSQKEKVEWWLPGGRRGGENRGLLFNGYRILVLQDEKSDGDGWW